jgi:hypothetical protein
MAASASSAAAVPSPVVQMPKTISREQKQLLDHTLRNLCAMGLLKKVTDGIGVVRYQPVRGRRAL